MKVKSIGIMFGFCVLTAACGYHFAGSGNLPSGVRTIFVEVLRNRTAETGVENIFTNELIYEFTRNNKEMVSKRETAEARLSGVIRSLSTETISRIGRHTTNQERVRVTVDLQLTEADGKIIWSAKGISANQTYDVSSDKQETERNRRTAITALSRRFSENVYQRLTDDF